MYNLLLISFCIHHIEHCHFHLEKFDMGDIFIYLYLICPIFPWFLEHMDYNDIAILIFLSTNSVMRVILKLFQLIFTFIPPY